MMRAELVKVELPKNEQREDRQLAGTPESVLRLWGCTCVLEDCQSIEEEKSLVCLCLMLDFLCFVLCFNDVFCYTHGQVAETTLLVFDLE